MDDKPKVDINTIEAAYLQVVGGYDQPDIIWGNGQMILYMRVKIGISDVNDSNGDQIISNQLYSVTKGGVTLPVNKEDDDLL